MDKLWVEGLAREAGELAKRRLGARVVRIKFGTDLVTEADEAVESFVRAEILSRFPDHRVLGEEQGASEAEAEWEWVVDPIDGTENFSRGSHYFAVSIALAHRGVAQIGAVYRPLTDEMFLAQRGGGATLNGEPLAVSEIDSVERGMFVLDWSRRHTRPETFAMAERLFYAAYKLRSLGSASLDICGIAAGTMEGFVHPGLAPWDFAAAQLILEEAGGTVTTLDGAPRTIAPGSVLATNGKVHAETLALLVRG